MKPQHLFIAALLALVPLLPQAAPSVDPTSFRIQMELGNLERAREWLDAGLDPDTLGDQIGSGLMIAAWEGRIPLMELFLSRGADINKTNRIGETALMHAAFKGHARAVRWLLERGAQVNRGEQQWSALHYAVFSGHQEIARELVAAGANIDARSPNGSSVLMMAIYEGHDELAKWLLHQGADASVRNDRGDGAVEWAMKFNRLGIARLVADAATFAKIASAPREQWGEPQRSLPAAEAKPPAPDSEELQRLLRVREVFVERRLDTARIDQKIAAERARLHRASLAAEAPPAAATTTLEITAKRRAPREQKARLIVEPR